MSPINIYSVHLNYSQVNWHKIVLSIINLSLLSCNVLLGVKGQANKVVEKAKMEIAVPEQMEQKHLHKNKGLKTGISDYFHS